MIGIDVQRFRALHCRRAWIRMGEHEARHAIGKRRLADSGRTGNQPSMWETQAAVSGEQRLFRLGVTVEDDRLAR
jgi:hypothetical protein